MGKHKAPDSLNLQIQQLQQQMTAARGLKQQQQQHFQHLLTKRLTSWPLVLGAVTAGLLVHHFASSPAPQPQQPMSSSPEPTHDHSATPEPVASWRALLSLPFLTQGIGWLLELMWQRGIAAHSVVKSAQRHPLYSNHP
ncbi:MAG: hypothetical protein KKA56_03650 [Gammaproteobacteria bacterium]|jgi:hypothetical protein|nr:hypothetical protein [Gammaproteobacteria bacterium]